MVIHAAGVPAARPFGAPARPSTEEGAPDVESDRLARVALSRLSEPGDPRLTGLVEELGAVRLRALLADECGADGLRTDFAGRLLTLDPEREVAQAERLGIRFLIPGDAEWPAGIGALAAAAPLQQRGGVPLGLWVRGPLSLADAACAVAVVGARSATTYGAQIAYDIAAAVGHAGLTVVSGAAVGIDQAAHRGALAAGAPTVAVLACGVDRAYPVAHTALIAHIARTGAVVSELPPGSAPTRLRFLARNRLIAGLATGTVVVEAAVRSGALNTANWADRLHRPVMGVPGPVTSAQSQGVHQLIRAGGAGLVTSGEEVLELVAETGQHLPSPGRGRVSRRDRLSLRHQQVLDAVPVQRLAGADSIARTAGMGLVEVRAGLATLEGHGLVHRERGGWRLTADARSDVPGGPESAN